jgi:hypothetical protein
MQFNELKKELRSIVFTEVRVDSDDYFEAVISKDKLTNLIARLNKFFVAPIWPCKGKLSAQIKKIIEDCGSIRTGQTLYFGNQSNDAVFVMLWPWQDGKHTTVKIVKK